MGSDGGGGGEQTTVLIGRKCYPFLQKHARICGQDFFVRVGSEKEDEK